MTCEKWVGKASWDKTNNRRSDERGGKEGRRESQEQATPVTRKSNRHGYLPSNANFAPQYIILPALPSHPRILPFPTTVPVPPLAQMRRERSGEVDGGKNDGIEHAHVLFVAKTPRRRISGLSPT